MTDSDIIKALECCASGNCNECPVPFTMFCEIEVAAEAITLIKRQQEEIEQLKAGKDNHPLTKDELMQMVGQPVWTVGVSHTKDNTWAMWDIIEKVDDDGIDFGYSTESVEWWANNLREDDGSLHWSAWVCYRTKPEVVDDGRT